MGFDNPVVGGTALRIPAIQSPNYAAGSAGWIIKIDGSAEFNNLTVRGEFLGTNFIINSSGIFLYSATPAAGKLIGSWANAAGTDAYTNAYPAGIAVGLNTKPQVHISSNASTGYMELPTNRAIENTIANILASVGNSGAANEYATLQLHGPSVTGATDAASIQLNSQNNDGTSEANYRLATGTGALTMDQDVMTLTGPRLAAFPDASASSALFVNTDSGYTGNMARFQLNAADRFTVDNDGILTTYATNAFTSYTPTVGNGGTATFTSTTGWWQRVGSMIFFNAEFVVNAAGSGAGLVTVTLPTTPYRAGGSGRQVVPCHSKGIWTAGMAADGCAVIMDTGSGAVIDQLSTSNDNALNRDGIVTGANLLAGSRMTIEGWYREV